MTICIICGGSPVEANNKCASCQAAERFNELNSNGKRGNYQNWFFSMPCIVDCNDHFNETFTGSSVQKSSASTLPDKVFCNVMGVGSEVYSPVSLGRKAIGIELKESYYKQAIKNCEFADSRFNVKTQLTLI